ncbi:Alpha-galactosidase 2 [Fusarium oxysporum f. sp. albedinis]|nr:Alpha-galactosidase 2 [Fusarium oxysporum f. sp. albedinis]
MIQVLWLGASHCGMVGDAPRHHPYPHNVQEGLGLLCISLNLASQKLQSLQPPLLPVDKDGMVDMLA